MEHDQESLELKGNFKTAAELGLSSQQHCGLVKTLAYMEAGRLHYAPKEFCTQKGYEFSGHFNMGSWRAKTDCGTIACIGGTAELLGGCIFARRGYIRELFFPDENNYDHGYRATPKQAAVALRGYLETGKVDWRYAMSTPA